MADAPPPLPKSQPFFKKRHLTMLKLFGVRADSGDADSAVDDPGRLERSAGATERSGR